MIQEHEPSQPSRSELRLIPIRQVMGALVERYPTMCEDALECMAQRQLEIDALKTRGVTPP